MGEKTTRSMAQASIMDTTALTINTLTARALKLPKENRIQYDPEIYRIAYIDFTKGDIVLECIEEKEEV